METSDIQPLRASKISRLPGPAVHAGLAELSESQHNARAQTAIPAPPGFKPHLKREIPQPAQQPDPKRKPLADRAAEYPTSVSISTSAASKLAIKGQTLPQLKRPTRHTTNTAAPTSLTSFAKSFGPARHQTDRSNPAAFRSSHARSKSQAARPRTAHGHRPEEHFEDTTSTNGTNLSPIRDSSIQNTKLRHMKSSPAFTRNRESSLTAKFQSLSIYDNVTSADGCRVASRHDESRTTSSSALSISTLAPNITVRAKRVEPKEARSVSSEA